MASESYERGGTGRDAAAVLRVLSGPEQGREFGLAIGSTMLGRDPDCDLVLDDPMVSRRHARINVSDTIEIIDQGSANGVLVAGMAVPRLTLRSGEVVTVGDSAFQVTLLQGAGRSTKGPVEFIRPPVVVPRHDGLEFELPQAPERPRPQRFPMIALIAPLLMGVVLFAITKNPASVLFIALSPIMMIGAVVEGRRAAKIEFKQAVEEYESDLAALANDIALEQAHEVELRQIEHLSTPWLVDAATQRWEWLWCRRPDQEAFGQLRLGLGSLPTRSQIKPASRNKAPHELVAKGQALISAVSEVSPVPVVVDLKATALGIAGPRATMLACARAQIMAAAILHAPSELVVTGVLSSEGTGDWSWLNWLPHVSSPHSPIDSVHLASSPSSAATLVGELERLLDEREDKDAETLPAVLFIVEHGAPVEHSRLVSIAEEGPSRGIYVIWMASGTSHLPAACKVFLDVPPSSAEGRAGYVTRGENIAPVQSETLDAAAADRVARGLAPLMDAGARVADSSDLPRSVSQFTLLGPELGSQAEAVLERWQASSSILSGPYAPQPLPKRAGNLRAVLGQASGGPHTLDLRMDGPHALVGGTTGSGKSELLQSWILALAAAHSPERVTFLLVDYKGGSAFSSCEHLPHTIGLVTDLSPHHVRRALTSLSAELRYREELLAEHGAKDLVELESHGVAGAPPSLILVVDEFAALVQEVPEFVDGVVNVAQRGRSLGIHLILATQRPAGVIKDNLRANTNLRLALRMADEADSADVLGSTDAADFDPAIPGRAMSKSGPRRLVPFQAAYAGGWTSDVPEPPELVVESLDLAAPTRWELPAVEASGPKDRDATDIKRLVRSILDANDAAGLPTPRKAWLPELKSAYDLALLPSRRRDDELVLAVADDPDRQAQPTVNFRPDREGNLAVYGTGGSGKSTFLRSVAVSAGLASRGGPTHVYGLDFGSRGLAMLEDLPHVGSIINGADHERVVRLITWLRDELDGRAERYSTVSAATITDYRRIANRPKEPRIMVLVDGMAAFRQAYEATDRQRYVDILTSIASEGRPVGIHLVLSSEHRSGIHTALASAIQRRIVLRMSTEDEYSMLSVPTDVLSQYSPPGRGIDREREIQIALLGGDSDVVVQAEHIKEFALALREFGVEVAPQIRSLPTEIRLDSLTPRPPAVVLGLDSSTLSGFAVEPSGAFIVTGPPASGRSEALATLIAAVRQSHPKVELHYFGVRRSELAGLPFWSSTQTDVDGITATASELAMMLPQRLAGSPKVVVIVEAAGEFVGSPADMALQDLAKACIAEEQWFVVEGEVSTLRSSMGFLGVVKSSRRGLVLQPDQESGLAMFNTPFPRANRADFPVGRGFLVSGGRVGVVQVALVSSGSG
ncbi:MAG TPA: FtsK/SpoIIIE domain-containing protein [Marmoricola sp.]|nr:FtsK/SpoIIIE domain-containing protein [Marmoricola sp.]